MKTEKTIHVALVEDNRLLRQELSARLQQEETLHLAATACNGKDFLKKMKNLTSPALPDVVLMDIEMETMDGIETTRHISREYPQCKVIMLTVFDDDEQVFRAIQCGAVGYLLKGEPFNKITEAIADVMAGGSWMSASIARKTINLLQKNICISEPVEIDKLEKTLSPREAEVLSMLVQGIPLPAVAEKLFISYGTVRCHVRRIYEKLQVNNKVEATQVAIKNKWFNQG